MNERTDTWSTVRASTKLLIRKHHSRNPLNDGHPLLVFCWRILESGILFAVLCIVHFIEQEFQDRFLVH